MSSETGSTPADVVSLQLLAETLVVSRQLVAGDTVHIRTITREIAHDVDEMLAGEQVEVERVPIGRVIETMPDVREEDGVTIIPIVEEVVVVERRLVLKEEIRILRHRVENHHIQTVQLRQQEAIVTRFASNARTQASTNSYDSQQQQRSGQGNRPMEHETIVAVYDTAAHAQAAVHDLEAANVPASDITQHAKNGSMTGTTRSTAPVHEKGFWATLFGGEPDHDTSVYGHSIDSGATVITVKVPSDRYDEAATILEKHNPVDVDERSTQYGLAGGTSANGNHGGKIEPAHNATEAGAIGASGLAPVSATVTGRAMTGNATTGPGAKAEGMVDAVKGNTVQLAEEFLNVGKRAVTGGTTRIRRYTVEKPVEENVTLHNERVVLDRRPVTDGRVLANADFSDKTISMTEMNEEAVVSKTARVVEEIGLHKEASDRVETVRDTLRKDDVEIEQVPTTERFEADRTVAKPVDRKI